MMNNRSTIFLSLLFFIFFPLRLEGQTSSTWTIAASPLENISSKELSSDVMESVEAAAKQIPQLILDNVNEGVLRAVYEPEQFDRDTYDLWKKRQSLFNEMDSLVKARDEILFQKLEKKERSLKLLEAEKKIEEQKEKIQENISEEKKLSENLNSENENKKKDSFFKRFLADEEKIQTEKIAVWKNDITQLFNYTKDTTEAQIIDAKINGLMTGRIRMIENYISVNMELRQYPGGKLYASATDVAHISALEDIAYSLARQLLPSLTNTVPVVLDILIQPEDIAENSVIYIADEVYHGAKNKITIQPGIDYIRIETPGCKSVNITYDFSTNPVFYITVKLDEEEKLPLKINSLSQGLSSFNFNAIPGKASGSVIEINGSKYIGEMLTEEGWSNFFLLDTKALTEPAQIDLPLPKEDISKNIEKARKRLYRSYGYVIFAMPFYFITTGGYENRVNAVKGNLLKEADAKIPLWQALKYTGSGLLGVALGNMVFQLGRYLLSANQVIPKTYTEKQMTSYDPESDYAEEVSENVSDESGDSEEGEVENEVSEDGLTEEDESESKSNTENIQTIKEEGKDNEF